MTAPYLVALASAGATAVSLPVVRKILLGRGILDHANARSSHITSTPRGGGLAVLLGLMAALAVTAASGFVAPDAAALAVTAGVLLLAATGLRDDLRTLSPAPRLAVQAGAGIGIGLVVSDLSSPALAACVVLGSAALTVFVVNTVNFMDGINGITGATMLAWGATSWWAGIAHDVPVAVVAGAVGVGTALGFLPFNVPRALVFLGDVGSYLYGGLVAMTSVAMLSEGIAPVVVAAPLVPYATDVVVTLLRRARRKAKLTQAHREHFYQQLTSQRGHSHAFVSLTYGLAAVGCGLAALTLSPLLATAVLLAVAAIIGLGGGRAPSLRSKVGT